MTFLGRLFEPSLNVAEKGLVEIRFLEYDLRNGLHVIMNLDKSPAVVSPNHKPEHVESAKAFQLESLSARAPREWELRKAKNQIISRWINRLARAMARADDLARFYTLFGDTGQINRYPEKVSSITGKHMSTLTRHYLSPSDCGVINYLPKSERWIG